MTSWVIAIGFSTLIVACVQLSSNLWRKHKARLCEEEQSWHDTQIARLKSLEYLLKTQYPAPTGYPELPKVRLAGLLPPPGVPYGSWHQAE